MAKSPEPTTDLATPSSGAVQAVEDALAAIWTKQEEEAVSDSAAMDRILAGIMQAESVEELLEGGSTQNVDNYLDTPLRITGFRVVPSSIKQGEWFVILDAFIGDTAIEPPLSCGSKPLKAQLVAAYLRDWFPLTAVIQRNETRANFRVYRLVPAPDGSQVLG